MNSTIRAGRRRDGCPSTQVGLRDWFGDHLIIRIDPRKVSWFAGGQRPATKRIDDTVRIVLRRTPRVRKRVLRAIKHRHPFVIGRRSYREPVPIEKIRRYVRIEDYLENAGSRDDTLWYRAMVEQLEHQGFATSNRQRMYSVDEIDQFFTDYVDPLIDSFRQRGYDDALANDIGKAMIGPDGSVHKSSSGNHRFCIARILGTPAVPLRIIGVHELWIEHADIRSLATDLLPALKHVQAEHSSH